VIVKREPRVDLALDSDAVLSLLGGLVDARVGARPVRCEVHLLKRTSRRIVVLYELEGGSSRLRVVGKWFSTERGALVADALATLRGLGFAGPTIAVPAPVAYLPAVRALFVEAVDGPLLREVLRSDPSAAGRAGAWLAAFHGSGLSSPRSCGPAKQARAIVRWAAEEPLLIQLGKELEGALRSLPDPRLPVHYDYYHSQVMTPTRGPTTVLDLDESGMGDPSFDVLHFEAHLELLALQWFGEPKAFSRARREFHSGYERMAVLPEPRPALRAFAWFKLTHQLLRRKADELEWRYALGEARRSFSAA
jgi:phosphotransferase family enzyme